jgi:hypothetical protein
LVAVGSTVNIEVTVGNSGPVSPIGVNKVRAQISVPIAICNILPAAQQTLLPPGWTVSAYTGGGASITVCNGSDIIPVGAARTILIIVQGNSIGGPSTVNGNLLFSNGAICTAPGSLPGDNTADNSSTSSIQVTTVTPLTLIDFNATLVNCQPVLNWKTENEINTDRFEVERSGLINSNWVSTGVVTANGNPGRKATYQFTDKTVNVSPEEVLYRLKMIDRDGHYKYSKVLQVLNDCKNIVVDVYPNPAQNGKLYLEISGATRDMEATLVTLSGQILLKSKIKNGVNYLNISSIASGQYVLKINDSNGFEKTVKVFIQN